MQSTYAPLNSEITAIYPTEETPAIRELQNQLIKARFVDKLAKFAKPAVDSSKDTQTASPAVEARSWKGLKQRGIAVSGICFALTSIAANPLGVQITVEPLSQWTSETLSHPSQSAMLQAIDATDVDDDAGAVPTTLLNTSHTEQQAAFTNTVASHKDTTHSISASTTPSEQQTSFVSTLFRESTTPGVGSGLAVYDLPLEQQAFLMTIAQAEGATYTTIYGGSQFSDFSRHPGQCIPINLPGYEGMCSDAAGKYQFLSSTWELLDLPDFSPKNQDRGAIMLIQETSAFSLLAEGDVTGAFCAVGPIWASLPCNSYEQNPKSSATIVAMYEENLQAIKYGQ